MGSPLLLKNSTLPNHTTVTHEQEDGQSAYLIFITRLSASIKGSKLKNAVANAIDRSAHGGLFGSTLALNSLVPV